jgi:hypothetical protein
LANGFDISECLCCGPGGVTAQKAIILTSLFVFIGGYQVGFGPVSWLIVSEIFPLKVRGKAVSIAVVVNFFCNTVMTFLFPVELEFIGASPTFYIYAIVLFGAIYFIYRFIPETKGMSLEEIEDFFSESLKITADEDRYGGSYQQNEKESLNLSPVI